MNTFMARFTRPNGEQGVIHVMAESTALAMLEVMRRLGPLSNIDVKARRRAALLVNKPAEQSRHV